MAKESATVRTSVELPAPLHRKLREEAARRGCSARSLIVEAVTKMVDAPAQASVRMDRLDLDNPPIIDSRGHVLDVKDVYDFIDFP